MTTDATVSLSNDLRERCERRIEGTHFDSVDEYVQFVVREVLDGIDADHDQIDSSSGDLGDVEDRLEALGYR